MARITEVGGLTARRRLLHAAVLLGTAACSGMTDTEPAAVHPIVGVYDVTVSLGGLTYSHAPCPIGSPATFRLTDTVARGRGYRNFPSPKPNTEYLPFSAPRSSPGVPLSVV
jgi:hypothetical protein